MAGHSAWKNIKHRKAAQDARRGKMWSKCARAIIVAARHGGGDPEANLSLRYAIDEARAVNMPRDTIENAIKKGTGSLGTEDYESALYEGYGPGGVAMLLEILTNNRNRTAPEVKGLFEKYGGKLGTPGSVAHQFQSRGVVSVLKAGIAEDALMEAALEAGAEDVRDEGDQWQVVCEPSAFVSVRKAVEALGAGIQQAGVTMLPTMTVRCTGPTAQKVLSLIEGLEDHDDVQKVHANCEIEDQEVAAG